MEPAKLETHDPPLHLVRRFLESLVGVASAKVWRQQGRLLARVVVFDDCWLSTADLSVACQGTLGEELTPSLFLLERALRRAA